MATTTNAPHKTHNESQAPVDDLPDRQPFPNGEDDLGRQSGGLGQSDAPSPNHSSQQDGQQGDGPLYSIFTRRIKLYIIVMTTLATFFSPLSSFIYLPALTPIAETYNRSLGDINLSVTVYQILQATAPLLFGDLSDQIGRRPIYMATFSIYIGANIGLALQKSYAALLVLRALQSAGSSATVAIASGIVSDISTSAERGGYIASVHASALVAPAIAPILGGVLTQYLGWPSVFWFLTILAGLFLIMYMPWVPETARRVVGDGSIPPPSLNSSLLSSRLRPYGRTKETRDDIEASNGIAQPAHGEEQEKERHEKKKFKIPVPNVWAAIRVVFEKDVGPLLIVVSLVVMSSFCMLIPLQDVIRRNYHLNDTQVGLCYIPFAAGSFLTVVINGKMLNWNYARVAKKAGLPADRKRGDDLRKFPLEKARLDLVWPSLTLGIICLASFGWAVDSGTRLAVPLVVLFFGGLGLNGPVSILSAFLVDLYPTSAGRVSSAFNLTRGALGAAGTAVVQYIIDAWGYGYTYTFLGALLLVSTPTILVVRTWGPKWREERYQRLKESGQE